MSLGSLERFERTGEISLVSLLRLAHALDATEEFGALFPDAQPELHSIDEIIRSQRVRRRGRRT